MNLLEIADLTGGWLIFAVPLFWLPTLGVVYLAARYVGRLPAVRWDATAKTYTHAAVILLVVLVNWLGQTRTYANTMTDLDVTYFNREVAEYELGLLWRDTLVPPAARFLCAEDAAADAFCTQAGHRHAPDGMFSYLYVLLLSVGPPALFAHMILRAVLWNRKK